MGGVCIRVAGAAIEHHRPAGIIDNPVIVQLDEPGNIAGVRRDAHPRAVAAYRVVVRLILGSALIEDAVGGIKAHVVVVKDARQTSGTSYPGAPARI